MGAWKLIVYPFVLAAIGMVIVDLAGIAVFGPNSHDWLDWQNEIVSAIGAVMGLAGFVGGVYLAIRSQAHLIP